MGLNTGPVCLFLVHWTLICCWGTRHSLAAVTQGRVNCDEGTDFYARRQQGATPLTAFHVV